jgi:hypothetical protein
MGYIAPDFGLMPIPNEIPASGGAVSAESSLTLVAFVSFCSKMNFSKCP